MENQTPEASFIGIIAKPVYIKIAQTVGVTASAFLAGQTATATYGLLPSILDSPAPLLLHQWRRAQETLKTSSICLTAVGASVFAYMASRGSNSSTTPKFPRSLTQDIHS